MLAQYPQPHPGWKLVPGGENLVATSYWGAEFQWVNAPSASSVDATSTVSVSNGALNATAGANYFGGPSPLGPWLFTSGDFGVVATIQTGPGVDGLISLTGSLATGSQYWQGMTKIEFGVSSGGDYTVDYWDGTASSPVFARTLKSGSGGAPPSGQVTVELLRQGGQFLLYFDAVQYPPIPDPGLFATRYVMPGFLVAPGQQINVTQFAIETPQTDSTAQLIEPVGTIPFTQSGDTLGSLAAVAGRRFSVAADPEQLALGLFSSSSPGSTPDRTFSPKVIGEYTGMGAFQMGFTLTQAVQGHFVFDSGDAQIANAKGTGRSVFCHGLIGGDNSYTPYWVVHGNFTKAQLTQILQTHVQTVVSHYAGQCEAWTVVNEAVAADGTLRTDNVWAQVIGPSYIDLAFQTAHQADPNAKLYYNDYQAENTGTKATGVYNLVLSMKQRGIPIDGVGLECHWIVGNSSYTPNHDQMVENMAQIESLGLIVRISELDVQVTLPASSTDLNTEATFFSTTVQACLDSPGCVEINAFGGDDLISPIPASFPGKGAATMFDTSFNPKPAYTAVIRTLRAAPKAPSVITKVNTAWGGPDIAQNTFIEVKGTNLVPTETPATGVDWSDTLDFVFGRMPMSLSGVSVTVNGKPAFVYFFCSAATSPVCTRDQIDVLTPLDNSIGPVQVVVKNGTTLSNTFNVNMKAVVPTFLLFNALGPVVATHLNYSLLGALRLFPGSSTPAKPGETVVMYAIGFGLPTNTLTNGSSSQSGSLPSVPVCQVGGLSASVATALIAPGLYQFDLTIPGTVLSGDHPVSCTYGGATTPSGAIITVVE
jgi:endo-1,4-beta-xylanase